MSTLAAVNLKNPSSGSNNIVLATGGDTTITNNFAVSGTGNNSIAGTFKFNSGYGSVATAYGCRAWANLGSNGSIRGSGNVSSVTKNATGDYTINFSTAMPDVNYSVAGLCSPGGADAFLCLLHTVTGSVRVRADEARGDLNPGTACVSVFR